MTLKNVHFDKDTLDGVINEVIIECGSDDMNDEDKNDSVDNKRYLIDIMIQLSQKNETIKMEPIMIINS